jgi:hypothetical protein
MACSCWLLTSPAEAVAEAYGVMRAQRSAMLERLNAELGEFA